MLTHRRSAARVLVYGQGRSLSIWTDHLIGNFTSAWKQDTRIQKFEEDGSQRDGEAALQGRGSGIRGFVGQLCGERRHVGPT